MPRQGQDHTLRPLTHVQGGLAGDSDLGDRLPPGQGTKDGGQPGRMTV